MFPGSLPVEQKQLLQDILASLQKDQRIIAISASGSYTTDSMDEYSDLDLTLVIEPEYYESVMAARFDILNNIEGLAAKFTGEHVGEPRVVISLFAPHALHVDFKFVSLNDAHQRVDDIAVLWEKDERYRSALKSAKAHYPYADSQWLEDRMWVWVHYAATKIDRGEYFDTLEFLSFLRFTVLSPLALRQHNMTPSGVRKIEERLPEFAEELKKTVALPEKDSLASALTQCIKIYEVLMSKEDVVRNKKARQLSLDYLEAKLLAKQ